MGFQFFQGLDFDALKKNILPVGKVSVSYREVSQTVSLKTWNARHPHGLYMPFISATKTSHCWGSELPGFQDSHASSTLGMRVIHENYISFKKVNSAHGLGSVKLHAVLQKYCKSNSFGEKWKVWGCFFSLLKIEERKINANCSYSSFKGCLDTLIVFSSGLHPVD